MQSEFVDRTVPRINLLKFVILNMSLLLRIPVPRIYLKKYILKLDKIVCNYLFYCMHVFTYIIQITDHNGWTERSPIFFIFLWLLGINGFIPPPTNMTKLYHSNFASDFWDVSISANYKSCRQYHKHKKKFIIIIWSFNNIKHFFN